MRQVSGSAVQGLEGAALRPDRLPGPRGFNLLSQLILDPVRGRSKVTKTREGVPVRKGQSIEDYRREEIKREEKEKMWEGGRGGGRGGEEGERGEGKCVRTERRRGRRAAAERCHCQSEYMEEKLAAAVESV